MKENPLKDKSFQFALQIIELYKSMCNKHHEFVLSKQMLRSGTSVGANIREAQNAQSNADFIHKLSIAQKECDETLYWLELSFHSNYIDLTTFETMQQNANEILRMLKSAIITTKQKK